MVRVRVGVGEILGVGLGKREGLKEGVGGCLIPSELPLCLQSLLVPLFPEFCIRLREIKTRQTLNKSHSGINVNNTGRTII